MDASDAAVGLSLSEDLIGLIVRLWASFANLVPILPTQSRTRQSYRFNLLLASLGPPASCCGEPGLEDGLFSGFTASRSCISISNFHDMQFSGDQTRIVSSFGFTDSCFCSTSSGVYIQTLWRFDCSIRTVTPFAWLIDVALFGRGVSTRISIMQVLSLSLLQQDGSEFESLDGDSVSAFPGITLMSTELSSLLAFSLLISI